MHLIGRQDGDRDMILENLFQEEEEITLTPRLKFLLFCCFTQISFGICLFFVVAYKT